MHQVSVIYSLQLFSIITHTHTHSQVRLRLWHRLPLCSITCCFLYFTADFQFVFWCCLRRSKTHLWIYGFMTAAIRHLYHDIRNIWSVSNTRIFKLNAVFLHTEECLIAAGVCSPPIICSVFIAKGKWCHCSSVTVWIHSLSQLNHNMCPNLWLLVFYKSGQNWVERIKHMFYVTPSATWRICCCFLKLRFVSDWTGMWMRKLQVISQFLPKSELFSWLDWFCHSCSVVWDFLPSRGHISFHNFQISYCTNGYCRENVLLQPITSESLHMPDGITPLENMTFNLKEVRLLPAALTDALLQEFVWGPAGCCVCWHNNSFLVRLIWNCLHNYTLNYTMLELVFLSAIVMTVGWWSCVFLSTFIFYFYLVSISFIGFQCGRRGPIFILQGNLLSLLSIWQ